MQHMLLPASTKHLLAVDTVMPSCLHVCARAYSGLALSPLTFPCVGTLCQRLGWRCKPTEGQSEEAFCIAVRVAWHTTPPDVSLKLSRPILAASCSTDFYCPSCLQLFSPAGDYLCTLASGVGADYVAVSTSGFFVVASYSNAIAYRYDPWVVGCGLLSVV